MVSVKRCTLPFEYIEAAKKLVSALDVGEFYLNGHYHTINNGYGYDIEYAFFDLRCDEDEEWFDGSWWLYIATDDLSKHDGIPIILHILELLNIDLPEFDFTIIESDRKTDKHRFDRIDIKKIED